MSHNSVLCALTAHQLGCVREYVTQYPDYCSFVSAGVNSSLGKFFFQASIYYNNYNTLAEVLFMFLDCVLKDRTEERLNTSKAAKNGHFFHSSNFSHFVVRCIEYASVRFVFKF